MLPDCSPPSRRRTSTSYLTAEAWIVVPLAALLDDAAMLHEATGRVAHRCVQSLVQTCPLAVRSNGLWRVRHDQRCVWRHLRLGDLKRLPDAWVRMQSRHGFSCRRSLLDFVHLAHSMQRGAPDHYVVFRSVQFEPVSMPSAIQTALPFLILAKQSFSVHMRNSAWRVECYLCNQTPWTFAPTVI